MPGSPAMTATDPDPSWRDRAACAGTPVENWFLEAGQIPGVLRRICAGCPVQRECLRYALRNHVLGIWAGTSAADRAALRRCGAA